MKARPPSRGLAAHRKKLLALGLFVGVPLLAHGAVAWFTPIEPPVLAETTGEPTVDPGDADLRVLGPAYARHRGKVLEVRLEGSPEVLGHQHGRLLYPEMVRGEAELYGDFEAHMPFAPARWLLLDLGRVRFRGVDQGMRDAMRREIGAEARAFSPDPFADFLPTYQRFVFLHSLYDIALSFERSPLVGCTSFVLRSGAFEGSHVVLARNFDFEATPFLDEGKAVFLVHEEGRLAFASVAWPGLVGVVSGMNEAGVGIVVHGARAREPRTEGEPVVHAARDALARAKTTAEAVAVLAEKQTLVSHLVLIADAAGDVVIVERAPGEPDTVRRPGGDHVPLTNHFEGPLGTDPKNQEVEITTSTRPRRLRLDELLANLPRPANVEAVVNVLRDRRAPGGEALPLGHRRAIDGLLATHGVVMDLSARVLWVSEGPHLSGRFVRFDVGRLLAPGYDPRSEHDVVTLPVDPLVDTEAYRTFRANGSPHPGAP